MKPKAEFVPAPLPARPSLTDDLQRSWIRQGERLLLCHDPIFGRCGARIGAEVRVPHTPVGWTPELVLGDCPWPEPAGAPDPVGDWADDPGLSSWVNAVNPEQDAVRIADNLASGWGAASIVVTSQRIAVVYATEHLAAPPAPLPVTSAWETSVDRLVGAGMPFIGRSVPPPRVVQFDFRDGSQLLIHDREGRIRRDLLVPFGLTYNG
ncbi:hypothetical protein SAMN05421504_10689 [Amycolatopsis xylanica]|uniref:Uncharacterized protein n=1 Tax=Amycolatopsis xylanica TaxID=589385 RepID=A0A1H3L826_9PSEU|nr:hypothetical protein [Amycolatopsis xylanica]SDY60098.1 hypothetical protein SAMN05421504_10689 [Amycolatopsis xylanica]